MSTTPKTNPTDSDRLAWLVREECVPEGFVGVSMDRYEFAAQVASEAGRDEATDHDCVEGFRRMLDAMMALHETPQPERIART